MKALIIIGGLALLAAPLVPLLLDRARELIPATVEVQVQGPCRIVLSDGRRFEWPATDDGWCHVRDIKAEHAR